MAVTSKNALLMLYYELLFIWVLSVPCGGRRAYCNWKRVIVHRRRVGEHSAYRIIMHEAKSPLVSGFRVSGLGFMRLGFA